MAATGIRDVIDLAWLFTDLMDEEKLAIEALVESLSFSQDSVVIAQGAPHAAIWIVADGLLDVKVGDRIVGKLKRGELFGEQAWLEGAVASASILAPSPVHLLRLNFKDFNSFLDKHADAHISILRKLAINLSQRLRAPR